jgi:hypothetical protein
MSAILKIRKQSFGNWMSPSSDEGKRTPNLWLSPRDVTGIVVNSCYTSWTHSIARCFYDLCYMTRVVQGLKLALSNGPNILGVFLPSHEDGNRASIRNAMFSSFWNSGRRMKFRTQVILNVRNGMIRLWLFQIHRSVDQSHNWR